MGCHVSFLELGVVSDRPDVNASANPDDEAQQHELPEVQRDPDAELVQLSVAPEEGVENGWLVGDVVVGLSRPGEPVARSVLGRLLGVGAGAEGEGCIGSLSSD